MNLKNHIILFSFCIFSFTATAQEKVLKKSSSNKKEAIMELSKSLEKGKSDEELAADYEKLAKELFAAGDYAKAEENLQKALLIYEKLKDKEKQSTIKRELAKIQEAQQKFDVAITNYNAASVKSSSKIQKQINVNDANRLMNQSNPAAQSKYIKENIGLLEETKNKDELVTAYQQMADVNMAMNEPETAISNLENALKDAEDKPEKVVEISREIAKVYTKEEKFDKAIEINEELTQKVKRIEQPKLEVDQLKQLADAYIVGNETEKGIATLQQAYQMAIDQHNTLEAKKVMDMLIEQYARTNETAKIIELYNDFNTQLEVLIASDSTLVDSRIYHIIEDKIARLEKERALKDELIKKKNTFNYVLIGVIILILIFVAFIIRTLYTISVKNKKIALQSLRREMNPHFIFNSLNSVNQFIAQNNELEANKYLSSYSKLMRNIMENSNKDFIPLSVELAQLKEYLQLENMRFSDKFTYTIDVDPELDADAVFVPNMLIQPQLENAVWHGLRYKETQGWLRLSIHNENQKLFIIIEDNGIGIKKSNEIKTTRQKEHKSRGLTNTQERISLLNNIYHTKIEIEITDKTGTETGVIVTIIVPFLKR